MDSHWDYESPFVQDITAGDSDIDGLGHVNNTAYIRWCEFLAWSHSASLGLVVEDYVRAQRAMAIHHAGYDYLQACFTGDKLKAATWITGGDFRLGMERRFQMINATSGETVFRGVWQLICVNLETSKPVRIPKDFIAAYRGALVNTP